MDPTSRSILGVKGLTAIVLVHSVTPESLPEFLKRLDEILKGHAEPMFYPCGSKSHLQVKDRVHFVTPEMCVISRQHEEPIFVSHLCPMSMSIYNR